MKKKLFVIGVAFIALVSCGKTNSSSIIIAVSGPYSGDLAPYGIPTQRAVKLVFADDPAVSLNFQDDQCDPSIAANAASNIIGTSAVAVIGHICSGATTAALNVYRQAGIPVISPSSTMPELIKNENNMRLFFRTIAPDDAQGNLQADFLVNTLGVKTVAILHDKGDYGKRLAEYVKIALGFKEVSIPIFEGITSGAADYSTVINKIASASVDAVVFDGYHPEASKLIVQLKRRGVKSAFISGDGIKGGAFLQLARDAAEGMYATAPKDNSENALYQQAYQQHMAKYSEEPGPFFYEGYSAAVILKQTIAQLRKNKQEVTPQTVREYIADSANTFDTPVSSSLSFDAQGNAQGIGFSVYQVKNGVYEQAK